MLVLGICLLVLSTLCFAFMGAFLNENGESPAFLCFMVGTVCLTLGVGLCSDSLLKTQSVEQINGIGRGELVVKEWKTEIVEGDTIHYYKLEKP